MPETFHSEAESQFFEYLLKKGYPRDSISFEPRLGDRHRPDFAITDPATDQRLAYFEVKGQIRSDRQVNAFEQIKKYAEAARPSGSSVYLASLAKSPTLDEPFDFYYVNKDNSVEALPRELFPTFNSLAADVLAGRKANLESSREQTRDHFQIVCWILAVVVLALAIADFVCDQKAIELIDATRLTLLGIVVALIVIPFAQKFKVMGIEYERFVRQLKDEKKKS